MVKEWGDGEIVPQGRTSSWKAPVWESRRSSHWVSVCQSFVGGTEEAGNGQRIDGVLIGLGWEEAGNVSLHEMLAACGEKEPVPHKVLEPLTSSTGVHQLE